MTARGASSLFKPPRPTWRGRLTKRHPPAATLRTLTTKAVSRARAWDLAMNKRQRRVHRSSPTEASRQASEASGLASANTPNADHTGGQPAPLLGADEVLAPLGAVTRTPSPYREKSQPAPPADLSRRPGGLLAAYR